MIDFKAKVEELRMQSGNCLLPDRSYASVKGIRWSPSSPLAISSVDYGKEVDVYFRIDQDGDRFVIKFLNGVTGYEAYNIDDLLRNPIEKYFSINAGSYKYARLDIDGTELMRFLNHFHNVIRPSLTGIDL